MTEEEALMKPYRRLWAAMLDSAIVDYRTAVMYGDECREDTVEKELTAMGFGDYVPMLKYGARRFRWKMKEAAHDIPPGRYIRMDCPSCDGKASVWIYNRRRSYCAVCMACGLRYRIEKEI